MKLLGIDVGTSGCKATVVDCDGGVLGRGYQEYAVDRHPNGWAELDANMIWAAVQKVVAQAVHESGSEGDIAAISVSSFGETVVPIARDGRIIGPGILYYDPRGADEAKALEEDLGRTAILESVGVESHPMYSICKIAWIKKHQPELFERVWKFLFFADLVLFKLGAEPATDYSLAARSMAFDVVSKQWSQAVLRSVGVDSDIFGKPVPAGACIGKISTRLATELGINENALLVAGGHDQACAALGAGAIREGIAVNGMGTVDCLTPCFSTPIINERMAGSFFACVPHVVPDRYVTYAFNFTSGSLLRWYRDNFAAEQVAEAKRRGVDPYQVIIEHAAREPSGLYVLPHFSGAATPYMDSNAVGAIIGLGLDSDPSKIIKAILEGIAFEMKVNMTHLRAAGVELTELRATGGLARSEVMLQLKADILGVKVSTLEVAEAGTMGVAILAGVAAGVYKDAEEGVERLAKVSRTYYPNTDVTRDYETRFEVYRRIYPAVRNIYGRDQNLSCR